MESESGERVLIHHDTPQVMTINMLDNPVWHALEGPHRNHAFRRGMARHYSRDMVPFSAIAEPARLPTRSCGRATANTEADCLAREPGIPCRTDGRGQMLHAANVGDTAAGGAVVQMAMLSEADIATMLELVAAAQPVLSRARGYSAVMSAVVRATV